MILTTNKSLFLAIFFLMILSLFPTKAYSSSDLWYSDIPDTHWAFQAIRILWEEGVTDGYLLSDPYFPENNYTIYQPDQSCRRAEFFMLLAKVFSLPPQNPDSQSFLDVPRNYCLYGKKHAYPYIEAICAANYHIVSDEPYFFPEKELTREEAATILIQSLGLSEYAQSLSSNEVQKILSVFSDADVIQAEYRHEVAAAVHLRILYGYHEGVREIRPDRIITRDEAAVILFRSCIIRVNALPNLFNPYGDGPSATTSFDFFLLKNRNITDGNLYIVASNKADILKVVNMKDWNDHDFFSYLWDGRDQDGDLLVPDTYFYYSTITDRQNNTYSSALKPIVIDRKTLLADVNPKILKPSSMLSIIAYTDDAYRVIAIDRNGNIIELKKNTTTESSKTVWASTYLVPADAIEGLHHIDVRAFYPYATLEDTVEYYVIDPLALSGYLEPSIAKAGEEISIHCKTYGNAVKVDAHIQFGESLGMDEIEYQKWHIRYRIPFDTEDGIYTVMLNAVSNNHSKWLPLEFQVSGHILSDYQFILTQ